MKNNSFRYLHLFLVICSAGLVFMSFSSKEEAQISRKPTSVSKEKKTVQPKQRPQKIISRGPASIKPFQRVILKSDTKFRSDIKMSSGYVLAETIGAIPLADWKPGMKPLISNDGVYGYFVKAPGDKFSLPVAYNKTMRKLHPVSTIVHVRGVDEATRRKLLSSGHQEYYYFKSIQRLSLKSSPEQVLKLYDSLKRQGLNAKLEVVREGPSPN